MSSSSTASNVCIVSNVGNGVSDTSIVSNLITERNVSNVSIVTTHMFTLSWPTFVVYFPFLHLFCKVFFGLVTIYFDPA